MIAMPAKAQAFAQLARVDRPIGTLLLLWPTLWALWLAAEGVPSLHLLIVFSAGVFLMRSAGCVINDFADRNLDGHVERTRQRPMPQGLISVKEALGFFTLLLVLAFALVLTTNTMTIGLSLVAALLASAYPFMKRYTHLPQLVLGLAFGWAIPMAFAATNESLPLVCWLLLLANLCWTVAYDTLYAMVDRDDDVKIGIKSTAILFGKHDRLMVALLQLATLGLLLAVGAQAGLGVFYHLSLLVVAGLFVYQGYLARERERSACFKAFLHNNYVGMALFIGLVLDLA